MLSNIASDAAPSLWPLEAPDGMLMFGVSTAKIFAVLQRLIQIRFRDSDKLTVATKLEQHVLGRDEFLIVIFKALMPGDVADRAKCPTADLAGSLGDLVGHREDLSCVIIPSRW